MRKILVTGGSGFIGRHVCDELLHRGITPVILDRHLKARRDGCEQILGNTRDAETITEAVAHVDGVIHLAGVLGTAETIHNPRPAAETNVLGGLNVFEAIAQYDLPAVNIAVGNYWFNNTYSITKNAAERFALMFNAERGTRIAVVRALNAYGPHQTAAAPFGPSKVRKIMPAFICRALTGTPIEVYGDGQQVMDMVHVRDVARTLVNALTVEHDVYDRVMDCGTGRPTTVNDIAYGVAALTGATVDYLPMRPGEQPGEVVLADPTTLPDDIAGGEYVPLETGTAETVDWYRTQWLPTWA
jgi:UDP-glucose 4-epimerase